MSDALDKHLARLMDIEEAAINYLSHLWAVEQGADDDEAGLAYWREQLERLTDV